MLYGRVALLAAALMLLAWPAAAQNRFAFVIGNDAYRSLEPLKKAVNDARSISASLQKLGFEVTLGENLGRREFVARFSEFESRIQPGDYAFLFYSGHGVDLNGANFLIPVDMPKIAPNQQTLLRDEAISTENLIQRLKERGTRAQVVVLDACRENPFRDTKGRSIGAKRGLGPTQAPGGVFVIYSAGVGEAALDRLSDTDADPNSVFTRSFIPLLENASLPMVTVAKQTRAKVKSLAGTIGQVQSPAYYDEVDGDLFLAGFGGNAIVAPPQRMPPSPPVTSLPPDLRIQPLPPVARTELPVLRVEPFPPPAPPPIDVQSLLDESKKLMSRSDFVGARETLTRAIKMNARSALAHSFRGYTYLLEADEIRARAGNSKSLLESAIKTYAAAFPDLDKAIELDSTYPPVRRHRGTVIMGIYQSRKAQGQNAVLASLAARAIVDFRKAVELDPTSKSSLNALGEAYVASGEYREAIKQFDQATALDSTFAAPYQGRCEAYRALGQLDKAYAEGKKSEARDNRPEARRCVESLVVARGR